MQAPEHTHSKMGDARPAKLDLAHLVPNHRRWSECKIVGKNVTVRSYAGAVAFGQELFVYGGLQILAGILGDFHSINLGQEEGRFQWKQIKTSGDNPGPRAKMGMVCTNEGVIYMIGGIQSTTSISNSIYTYTISTQVWKRVQYKGDLPPIQSFGCCLVNNEKILMVCGFEGTNNSQTNAVFEYDITHNQITQLFQNSSQNNSPPPRSNCGAATDGKSIYVFGGCKGDQRMNDLWGFDITSRTWGVIKPKGESPVMRSGHILQYHDDCLFMYGGLHQVTWELDDLHLFDLKAGQWKMLEVDSARKKKPDDQLISDQKPDKYRVNVKEVPSPLKKKEQKYFVDTVTTMKHKNCESRKDSQHENPERETHGGSMLDEKKRKQFLQKKAQMLKLFEVQQQHKGKYLSVQPISQALKNSLDIVCHGGSKQHYNNHNKITDFGKSSVSKFMQPLSSNVNVVYGKKPCARDGHNSVWIGSSLVIFGGDRHHMSFNDIYRLDTKDISKQFS